ncbi:MAG: 50S ribosomal protein L35 [Fastidiosipilaceae bacterium]|jgi:large subunit ribosomal protein L35|nr:50S ribosomal protein L35 [Clostridiaceae bacterium]
MPKQKTHSSSKKRFKVSGKGKVITPYAYKKHKAEAKSPKRRRQLRGTQVAHTTNEKRIKKMIPYK